MNYQSNRLKSQLLRTTFSDYFFFTNSLITNSNVYLRSDPGATTPGQKHVWHNGRLALAATSPDGDTDTNE